MNVGHQINQEKIDICKEIIVKCYSQKKKYFAMIKDNFPNPNI